MVASHIPHTWDLAPSNPGMCPDWESNQRHFGSQSSAQSTDSHQPGLFALFSMLIDSRFLWIQFILVSCHSLFLCMFLFCFLLLTTWPVRVLFRLDELSLNHNITPHESEKTLKVYSILIISMHSIIKL